MSTPVAAKKTCTPATATQITDLLVDWVSRELRPLSIIGDAGLKSLLAFVMPGYVVPSRTHLTRLLLTRHAEGKTELQKILQKVSWVCLTTDAWSSRAAQSFMTVTCHFVDKTGNLASVVLTTCHFPGSHTSNRIVDKVEEALAMFTIKSGQVIGIVQDEAANTVLAGKMLPEKFGRSSFACSAHLLQTAIRRALDGSPIHALLAVCRRVVCYFRHSNQATEELLRREAQLDLGCLKLVQDVPTCWNSAYLMMERLLTVRQAVTAVLSVAKKKEHRDLMPSNSDWDVIEELIKVLKPFQVATTVFSGQKYVTVSLVFPVITSLHEQLHQAGDFSASVADLRSKLADALTAKFGLDTMDPASPLVIASAIDPRFHSLDFLDQLAIPPEIVKSNLKDQVLAMSTSTMSKRWTA